MMREEETETMVVFQSSDGYDFKVSEKVVLESGLMKDQYLKDKKNHPDMEKYIYRIPGVTRDNLDWVIKFCNKDFGALDLFKVPLVNIFNFIQASHFLKIERLMEDSCHMLVFRNTTSMKPFEELRNQQQSEYDCNLEIDMLLRSRIKDTFINDYDFSQVYISPFVLSQLRFVKRGKEDFKEHLCKIAKVKQLPELLKAIRSFKDFIYGDPRLAYCIRAGVVQYFIKILHRTHFNPDFRLDIQRPILSILSCARYDICGDVIEHELLPLLVGLVSNPNSRLATSAVIALTRIAYTFPDCIKVIVDKGALEAACTALDKHSEVYWSMEHLAKFLATICRGYSSFNDDLSFDKVGKILTMLDIVCQKWSYGYRMVHTVTCYALLYLSYDRRVAFEDEVWNRLRQRLVDYISIANDPGRGCRLGIKLMGVKNVNRDQMLAGSALGVVGHIMRWGNQDQMQSLTEVPRFWGCLRSMLDSKLKKFQMEACQIISNMAARRTTLIIDMVEADVEQYICRLLIEGGSDVKMEAAWAIFNIICGHARLFSASDVMQAYMKCDSIRYDDIDTYHEKAEY